MTYLYVFPGRKPPRGIEYSRPREESQEDSSPIGLEMMLLYIQYNTTNDSLLTRWTGTRPALAAATIWSTGFSRSCSGRVCLVAARVRKALTSEN